VRTVQFSFDSLKQSAFGIDRFRHDHPGKMATRRGSSARSDGNASTTSLFSENGTFGICCIRINNITMKSEPTCRCTRMRRFRVMFGALAACSLCLSWAGYTISMFEFEFPTRRGG
jgi:hypothetical protein